MVYSGQARVFENISGSECITMDKRNMRICIEIRQVGVGFVVMGALGYVVKLSMC